MIVRALLFLTLGLCFFSTLSHARGGHGSIVLIGGNLSSTSGPILTEFIKLSGGKNARIGVIPAATNAINKRYRRLVKQMESVGINSRNLELLEVAALDDQTTKGFDESSWASRGDSYDLVRTIDQLDAVWFLDGDQTRVTEVLLTKEGKATPVLNAIKQLFERGGVIAGVGGGAAALSRTMIVGGDSVAALTQGVDSVYENVNQQEYGRVITQPGLGLFKTAIVDTGFTRQARLGRAIVALLKNKKERYAIGIDENTGMFITNNETKIIGEKGISLINTSKANGISNTFPLKANNVYLSYLKPGDGYHLKTHRYTPRKGSKTTYKKQYFDFPVKGVSGLLSPNRDLETYLGYMLLDNKQTSSIETPILDGFGKGVKLTFSEKKQTRGYWSQDVSKDAYSFTNVMIDIEPLYYQVSSLPFRRHLSEDNEDDDE